MTRAMNTPATSRRRFLQTSLAGAVSLPAWAAPLGANSDVRVAVIGFRGRGGGHIKELLKVPGVRLVALCDVDSTVVDKKVADLDKQGIKVKTYRDFRECCADKDIDAITIATPNHSHTLIALTDLANGKHVYVEKPVCHNPMEGRKLVSTKGTTPLKAVEQTNRERLLRIQILEAPDHGRAVEMVEKGEADAFVMDDVLLYGLAANRPNPAALKVVGRFLTTEPLAIMISKNDPEFKKLVDEEMRRLILSREIYPFYDKWFTRPIPPRGTALNLPVSYLLRDFWKYPTDQVPF